MSRDDIVADRRVTFDDSVTDASSPTVSERGTYVCATHPDFTGSLYLHRRSTGTLERVAEFSYGVAAPLVLASGGLVVATLGGRLAYLDPNGHERRWQYETPSSLPNPPVVADHLIAVDFRGRVVALDPVDGRLVWERELSGVVDARPVEADGTVYVAGTETLTAFSVVDGERRWTADCETLADPVVVADGVVVPQTDGSVECYDRATGDRRWRTPLDATPVNHAFADDESVYVADRAGGVVRLDATEGRPVWQREANEETVFLGETRDGLVSCTREACRRRCRETGDLLDGVEVPTGVDAWSATAGRTVGSGTTGIVVVSLGGG